MIPALNLKQLFSVEERCLPNGRQALSFSLDFSVSQSFTLGRQDLGGTRSFTGIKGVYLNVQESAKGTLQYGIKTNTVSPFNFLSNYARSTSGSKYYFGNGLIEQYGSAAHCFLQSPPVAGYIYQQAPSAIEDKGNNLKIGIDGNFYALLQASAGQTTGVIGVAKINPITGATISTTTIAATTTSTIINESYMLMDKTGTLWISYGTNNAGVITSYCVSVDTSTMAVTGTFTGPTTTTATGNYIAPILTMLNNGDILMVSCDSNDAAMATSYFSPSSLANGVYSGSINGSNPVVNFIYGAALNIFSNLNNGAVVTIQKGTAIYFYRLDAGNYLVPSTSYGTSQFSTDVSSGTSVVIGFTNDPSKGQESIYVWDYSLDANGNATRFNVLEVDSQTLQIGNSVSLPFQNVQTGAAAGSTVTIDLDTDFFYQFVSNELVNYYEFGYDSLGSLIIDVNGTGQRVVIANPIGNHWIPLACQVNDNVNISMTGGFIKGFFTNYDIEPFTSN